MMAQIFNRMALVANTDGSTTPEALVPILSERIKGGEQCTRRQSRIDEAGIVRATGDVQHPQWQFDFAVLFT